MANSQKSIVSLDQQKRAVKFSAFELDNKIVFEFFDRQPAEQRDELVFRAIYIGVLALMEDRLSAFLAKTQNELGAQLESLKLIFEMKKEIFFKTAVKGMAAEEDVIGFLRESFRARGWEDTAEPTGSKAGKLSGNKTGDILCRVAGTDRTIVIEVKYDKSYRLGDILDKDIFTKKADTAWSQILEAKANRDGSVGIIVFDKSLVDASITRAVESVGFIRGVGFVAIVDARAGDYSNLAVAYSLARDIVLHAKTVDVRDEVLVILIKRILNDLERLTSVQRHCRTIAAANRSILEDLQKGMLSMRFTMQYLGKFLKDGQLTREDLFAFYEAEPVKSEFSQLSIDAMLEDK